LNRKGAKSAKDAKEYEKEEQGEAHPNRIAALPLPSLSITYFALFALFAPLRFNQFARSELAA
jgi:hypothetical protein